MSRLQMFLNDDDKRLFEINSKLDIYIKRVYTENGIVFECCNVNTISTFSTKNEVINWYNEI